MATFVLVHGAHLGSWSWNLVISALNRKGHRAINIDLPVEQDLTAIDYAKAITNQIEINQPKEELVLVGHSFAGLIIPLLTKVHPVRKLIYIAPLLARPGYSIEIRMQQREKDMFLINQPIDPVANRADAFKYWLHDCSPDIAYWAASRFKRQPLNKIMAELPSQDSFPIINSSLIVCSRDRLVNPKWLENTGKELLKVEPLAIDSGHCPQLSHPEELALLLMQLGNMRK